MIRSTLLLLIRNTMNLLPNNAPIVVEALDGLLNEVHVYGQNVQQLNWTPELRHFQKLHLMLEPLHEASNMGTEMLASRMIDLGGHPNPQSQAIMARYVSPAMPVHTFSDATRQVLHDSQQLLEAIRETFEVATEYNDQATIQLLVQAAHYIQHTIWTFGALRSAILN